MQGVEIEKNGMTADPSGAGEVERTVGDGENDAARVGPPVDDWRAAVEDLYERFKQRFGHVVGCRVRDNSEAVLNKPT